MKKNTSLEIQSIKFPQPDKMALVGMDVFFGSYNGLNLFERSIYEGNQNFISVHPQRWQGIENQEELLKDYGFESGKPPLGAYIKDFEIEALHFQTSSNEADLIDPQELLMLKVASNALNDAGLKAEENVAIIISTPTELSIQRLQKKIPKPIPASVAVKTIGNDISSRITAQWHFTGPSFTFAAEDNSGFKALEVAQRLLAAREVDTVLVGAVDLSGGAASVLLRNQLAKINTNTNTLSYGHNANGWMVGEGAGAVVLKLHEAAKQQKDRIYAVIDAISLIPANSASETLNSCVQPSLAQAVTQACQQAFSISGIKSADVGYLEVFGSGIPEEDESEIQGLIQAYQTSEPDLSCAIGSVKANIGHTYAASGIASLIKTALCLYYRYIPATPQWTSPKMPEVWQSTPFYVALESRPWFLEKEATRRVAAINSMELDGTYAHLILSEEPSQSERSSRYLEEMSFYLLPLAADDRFALLEQLRILQQTIEDCSSLPTVASQTFAVFNKRSQSTYALAILGHNKDELTQEIQRTLKGVANAFETGEDWQTPRGSYFTAKPMGKQGKIAFVYPGAFNSYIGLGRDLFRLFPKIYNSAVSHVPNIGGVLRDRLLYPRSLKALSRRQLENIEQQLIDDPLAMLESGIAFAAFLTEIMRDYFQVQPQCTFGYSLGEISMMCAQDVWTDYDKGSYTLNSSPLFSTRLSGSKNAVREYWGLPLEQTPKEENFWSTYILMAPVSQVKEYLKNESRVYLTHINTPNEVAIAGDPQACQRVIESLKCNAFRFPSDNVIHCEAMQSEYNELVKLNILPLKNIPETVFYSAAEYEPITLESHSIGHNIAKGLCKQLDFPRLINRVYEDGVRIFVEAGSGSTCSRWINETLKHKEHVTVPLNKRGVDDHTSIVKALAKLVSHRVSLDLSPLYSQAQKNISQSQSISRTVRLGGCQIVSLSDKNNKSFKESYSNSLIQDIFKQQPNQLKLRESKEMNYPKIQTPIIMKKENASNIFMNNTLSSTETPLLPQEKTQQKNNLQVTETHPENHQFLHQIEFLDYCKLQCQQLSENSYRVTKAHASFLQSRQESLQQLSEIVHIQLVLCQQVLNEKS